MDFNFLADPRAGSDTFYVKIIQLLQVFMRIRFLCLTGNISTISYIMGSLFYSSPIQSHSICTDNETGKLILPNHLFGGKDPIRRLQFIGGCRIDAPDWLLRGVTYITTKMWLSPSALLNQLYPMSQSSLTHLEYSQPPDLLQSNSDMDNLPTSPIQMPQLVSVMVCARSPDPFILLNRLLLSHVDAKWRLELYASKPLHGIFCRPFDAYQIDYLSEVVEAANGFKCTEIAGTQTEGWRRLWTGNAVTT